MKKYAAKHRADPPPDPSTLVIAGFGRHVADRSEDSMSQACCTIQGTWRNCQQCNPGRHKAA